MQSPGTGKKTDRGRFNRARIAALCALALLGSAVTALKAAEEIAGEGPKDGTRFDHVVRNDFFMGMSGNQEALDRGMKTCEEVLAKTPKHAEALVWHGAGLMFQAGREFTAGNTAKGIETWTRSLKEMDEAVKLEPKNVGVRVPRAAALVTASRYVPDKQQQKALLERVVADYGAVYDMQKAGLGMLGVHPRGELLFGLAEGWRRLGDEKKARLYLQQIVDMCKESPYETQAREWLTKDAADGGKSEHTCIGCHVE